MKLSEQKKRFSLFISNEDMNSVVSRNNLPSTNDGAYLINFDDKKVKEQIGFPYLLTEIQLYILILLEWNIFLKMY